MISSRGPAAALVEHVEALWHFSGQEKTSHQERVLPSGRFHLIVDLEAGRGSVSGMRSRYSVINPAAITSLVGIVFRPGGAHGLLDAPASDFHNQFIALELAASSLATELERLHEAVTVEDKFVVLESALLRVLQCKDDRCLTLHPSVRHGLAEFRLTPHIQRVSQVAKDAGLSRRRFSQLFREQVGMTPKLYCRLRRFRQVVHQIATRTEVDWTGLAFAGGYSDQAHLGHEFHDFSGLTPSDYVASVRPFPNHIRVG
jgi:AraC-like DNA-binding protein